MYPERQKRQKTRFVCNFNGKSLFPLYPARYYATPRHNPRSDFYKNGLKLSARLEGKKVKKFQREKITTGRDITKNVEGGGGFRPPPGSFRVKTISALFGKNKILIKFQTWYGVWSRYSVAVWQCDKQCKTNQYEHSVCAKSVHDITNAAVWNSQQVCT